MEIIKFKFNEYCIISDINVKHLRLVGRHNQLPKVGVSEDGPTVYRLSINGKKSFQAGKKSNRRTWMCEFYSFTVHILY